MMNFLRPRIAWGKEGERKFLDVSQNMTLYESMMNRRILPMYGVIFPGYNLHEGHVMVHNAASSQFITDTLWALSLESSDPIHLVIDSPGGSVEQGMIIYDMIKSIDAPVYTVGKVAYSMAAIILAAGEPGHRYVFPHSRGMIHQTQAAVAGTQEQVDARNAANKRQLDDIIDALQDCGVRKDREQIMRDMRVDNWMGSQEMIDYGLADQIIRPGAFGPE